MGTTAPPGGFDLQSFFGSPHAVFPNPPLPHASPSHPYPSPHPYSYPGPANPLPNPYPYNNQSSAPMYHSYMHYGQDHGPRPPPYPSSPFNQLPSAHSPLSNSTEPPPAQSPANSPSPPLDGARLMALLTTHSAGEASNGELPASWIPTTGDLPATSEVSRSGLHNSVAPPPIAPAIPTAPPVNLATPSAARLTTKHPKGRAIYGEKVVYDIDVRLPGEAQPQLEVSPITVYGSDPVMVVGRQIAVNRDYICYGLRAGTIRILNSSTALRALLRGHTQRVTDMAFLAEGIHLLASASSDGRIFVRQIVEGTGDDGKLQIKDNIVVAFQLVGDWQSVHPLVCWHPLMQKFLYVAIGKYLVAIDVAGVDGLAPLGGFTVENIVECNVQNPPEGVYIMCGHEGDLTSLAVTDWLPDCVATASQDGMVRFWGSGKSSFTAFIPHEGQSVATVAFLAAPGHSNTNVLLTAGPLNRELKLWAPVVQKELPSSPGRQSWGCIQKLEFQSSCEPAYEKAFFNQIVVLPRANLILLANAKKNAIYAVHVEFGVNASSTRMHYIAEFSVTMPILSLTATSDLVANGEGTVQVYCVQTQAIQLYTLDIAQCLPSLDDEANTLQSGPEAVLSPGVESVHASFVTEVSTSLATLSTGVRSTTNVGASGASSLDISLPFGASVDQIGGQATVLASDSFNKVDFSMHEHAVPDEGSVSFDGPGEDSAASSENAFQSPLTSEASSIPPPLVTRPSPRGPGEVATDGITPEMDRQDHPEEPSAGKAAEGAEPLIPKAHELDSEGISCSSRGDQVVGSNDGDKVPDPTLSSLPISSQHQNSTPSQLLTPLQLMELTRGSKGGSGSSGSPRLPPHVSSSVGSDSCIEEKKLEEPVLGAEVDNLTVEGNDFPEGHLGTVDSSSAVEDAVQGESSLSFERLPDLNYQTVQIAKQERTSFVGYEEDVADEVMLVEDTAPFDERDGASLHARETHETVLENTVTRTEALRLAVPSPPSGAAKGRKNKNKATVSPAAIAGVSDPVSQKFGMPPIANTVVSSEGESAASTSFVPGAFEGLSSHVFAMQDSLNQLVLMQKELQKQLAVAVALPVAKEGKRIESLLGQRLEKVLKAHSDAMWARIQDDNVKREKADRERAERLTLLLTNFINKDLPAAFERVLKKEISTTLPTVGRLVTPIVEKAVASALAEGLQKSISEKVAPQLEKVVSGKLETCLSRQLQSQFQTTGRQILQESIRSSFEGSIIPAFDRSCRSMFEQVDAAFQKGMAEHTSHAQQQFNTSHSALADTLQDAVTSATSLVASLKGDLADGQRKLVALAETAGATAARAGLGSKQSNGALRDKVLSLQHLEESLDPTIELSRLVAERKFEEAFTKALSLSDVAVVSWLCSQVEPEKLGTPLPLSQGVLLSLVQQLGCELNQDTSKKLTWIQHAALGLNPNDPVLAPHMRPFLEQLYQNLHRQMVTSPGGDMGAIRLVIHVVNSLLTACK